MQVRTLVVVGKRDEIVPAEHLHQFYSYAHDLHKEKGSADLLSLLVLENCDHFQVCVHTTSLLL
ncbi:hypothetical protein EON64_19725 [archaeon]|nr:MAG: hypothetical protein EON64_19725 [archaeon]